MLFATKFDDLRKADKKMLRHASRYRTTNQTKNLMLTTVDKKQMISIVTGQTVRFEHICGPMAILRGGRASPQRGCSRGNFEICDVEHRPAPNCKVDHYSSNVEVLLPQQSGGSSMASASVGALLQKQVSNSETNL
jgi:hypothetical protein